jgi:hypothetical protein
MEPPASDPGTMLFAGVHLSRSYSDRVDLQYRCHSDCAGAIREYTPRRQIPCHHGNKPEAERYCKQCEWIQWRDVGEPDLRDTDELVEARGRTPAGRIAPAVRSAKSVASLHRYRSFVRRNAPAFGIHTDRSQVLEDFLLLTESNQRVGHPRAPSRYKGSDYADAQQR